MKSLKRIALTSLLMTLVLTLSAQNPLIGTKKAEKDPFDTPIIDSLKLTLERCYLVSIRMKGKEGSVLEAYVLAGKDYYEQAYSYFTDLQLQLGDDLSRGKRHLISEALKLYSEIYNNKYATHSNYLSKVEYMRKSLEKFPYGISEVEKDFQSETFRVNIPKGSKQRIKLPSKGNYCLWEMNGDSDIAIEGSFPSSGFGFFRIKNDQLPIYLGSFKEYLVTTSFHFDVQLVFKPCERK